jgi:protein TonB
MLAAQFLFRPATDDGKPVSSKVIIPVTFAEMGPLYGDLRDVLVLNRGFWLAAPTRQDVAAVYPRGPATRAEPGRTTMRCTLTRSGGLKNCRVGATEPADKGFEDAALRLASKFKSVPTMLDGRSVADALVDVPLSFDPELLKPGGADANPSVSHPDWTKAPSKAEALSLFPAQARAAGVKHGSAVVACTVALDGALTACATLSESPPGLGFGEAARTFASQSAMSVWSREGRSVVGARVSVPVRLDQPEPSGSASAANR